MEFIESTASVIEPTIFSMVNELEEDIVDGKRV